MAISNGVALAAATITELHEATAPVTVNVSACNTAAAVDTVKVLIGTTAGGAGALEYHVEELAAVGSLGNFFERTGIVLNTGERLFVEATNAGVKARVHGY